MSPMFSLTLSLLALGASSSGAPVTGTSSRAAGALAEAAQRLEDDQPRLALERLRSADPRDPLARWLAARAYEALDRADLALLTLGPPPQARCLPASEDVVRAEHVRLGARLLARSDPAGAARALESLGTAEALADAAILAERGPERRRLEARLLVEHAETPEARALFDALRPEGVLERFDSDEARLTALEAFVDAHDNERADDLARALETRLGNQEGARPPNPPSEEAAPPPGIEPRNGEPEAARPLRALRCRLLFAQGTVARKLRAYDRALSLLRRARPACVEAGDSSRAMRAALLEARVLGIRRRPRAIQAVVAWMRARSPGHSFIDDALFYQAEAHRGAGSTELLHQILDLGGDQAPEAAWRLAREALDAGRPAEARALLERIPGLLGASSDDLERAEHHLARLEARTRPAAAAERWARLAARPSFYGFIALDRLRRLDPAAAERVERELLDAARALSRPGGGPEKNGGPPGKVLATPEAARARLWHAARAPDWAEAELAALACQLEAPSVSEVLELAALLQGVGAHALGQRLIRGDPRRLLEGPLTADTAPRWRLAYPRAFVAEVEAAAGAEGLDPLLLTALAREESTFEPEIVSWAGATGLAQLMPPTAIGAYASVFGGRLDLERLVEPALNLRLGARVLKEGLRTFGGTEAFALSAYNGGPGLTRRTLPDREVPFEDWAESNPVKENRGYVKRVLATWGIYRLLYAEGPAGPRIPRSVGPGPKVAF